MIIMLAFERYNKIIELLHENKKVTTDELNKFFGVSSCTIRNDLNKLEKDGLLRKIHGGAVLPYNQDKNIDFNARQKSNMSEKDAICKCALKYVRNGQCILLDASSTSLTLAKHLHSFDRLTVVTTGIYTALELKDDPNITVILTGGVVTKKSSSLEGLLGKNLVSTINADIAFVSAHGFTLEEGLSDFNVYEAELKKTLVKRAKKTIALLDYSKLGRNSTASFALTNEVNLIITDDKADKSLLDEYRKANINIEVCENTSQV
jgi:DeoR/GlpR family transcriptional regulator of sugar metabolism